MKSKLLPMLICILLLCAALLPAMAAPAYQAGDQVNGFTVTDVRTFDLIGADTITLTHDKTGAAVMLLLNEDTNRVFDITFRTVAETNEGTPHVFEHATLDGSEKYPSKALFFNLSFQTYNTYMNAATYHFMTTYPIASLSEEQLLKFADYYLDSCFHPIIKTDESIFREEAWRYVLASADDPLTITGTVYNEMKGALTLSSMANYNFKRTLFPGSVQGNVSGGDPASIPEMSWQSLCDYHDAYYHPSNSLSFVYGKIEDPAAFLALLDGVFSAYEAKDVSGLFTDSGYTPLTEAASAVYAYPVEEGTDTENGTEMYYGFRCDTAPVADVDALDLLSTMINAESSVFQQLMKEKLPSANGACYIDIEAVPIIYFHAEGLNAEDADTFVAVVEQAIAQIAQEGFLLEDAEAIEASTKLDVLLTPESSEVGVDLIPNIAYYWAACGRLYGYMDYIDQLGNFTAYVQDGTFRRVAEEYLVNNPIRALAVTEPVPGLKEQQDAALAEQLEAVKAAMTEEEIAAIVAATNEPAAEEADTAAMVAALSAVTVDTLPEEYRLFDIQDTTLDNNVRSLYVNAAADGLGKTMLRLDISTLPQEELHWLALYLNLLGDMDTESHTQSELATLTTRYTNGLQIGIITPADETAEGYTPYLRIAFNALDEDLQQGYDLVAEMLFSTDFSDTEALKGRISNCRTSLKQAINNGNYAVMLRRMFSRGQASYSFYDYINYLPYYSFLCEVEEYAETAPDVIVAALQTVRDDLLKLGHSAVYGYVGAEKGCAANNAAATSFLARMTAEEQPRAAYEFEPVADSEALILDINTSFNEAFITWEELGLEEYTADWDVICALVNDRYMLPELRDARGAYGAYLYPVEAGLYAFSYRDPGVADTFGVFSRLGEMLAADTGITQDTLNGYILSCYSTYAQPQGELTDGYSVLGDLLNNHAQEEKLENMQALKAVTVDSLPGYAEALSRLMTNGIYGTVSSASVINANEALYQVVRNPFSSVDASQVVLTDVSEDHPYYAAIRYAFENGYMTAEDGAFEPDRTLTLGELAVPLYVAVGGPADADEAIAFLAQYEIIPDVPASTGLTRSDTVLYATNFCMAVGIEVPDGSATGYADDDQIPEAFDYAWAFMLDNGMIEPTADNRLDPDGAMTRGAYALMLAVLME